MLGIRGKTGHKENKVIGKKFGKFNPLEFLEFPTKTYESNES
jgi:hypothetical protein